MTIDTGVPIPPSRLPDEHAQDWAQETRARAALLKNDLSRNLPAEPAARAVRLAAALEAAVALVEREMGSPAPAAGGRRA